MHPQHIIATLAAAYDGEHARRLVAEIARYHRVQASPDFRAAANWLARQLRAAGVQVSVESYPADHDSRFGVLPSFQEWHCRQASLVWQRGEKSLRLCDYRISPLHVIQRSAAVQGEFTVVDVGQGEEADYEGVDVRGEVVLSRAPVARSYERAVVQRGAVGILFDNISASAPGRNPTDLPDARQYSSFWWQPGQAKCWGFVLSPRQGDAMRQALAAGETVRVQAHIEAEFYDGAIEVVSALIPGSGGESVLAMAHLCHPYGFANDNASGAACLLELAINLQQLISDDRLPQPERSIRFLWVPEMTGTYAWLNRHHDQIANIVAGINLDMVGQKQETTGAVWVLEEPPAAMASFAAPLLAVLRRQLLQMTVEQEAHVDFPRLRYTTSPFHGGSDHMVTSDPQVGIPTPMLIQWPDRFYHTTADTMEHVDPQSLWLSGVLAGSYLMWLATADAAAAAWLGWEMVTAFERRLARDAQDGLAALLAEDEATRGQSWERLQQRIAFWHERQQAAQQSLNWLAAVDEHLPTWQQALAEAVARVQQRLRQQLPQPMAAPSPAADEAWWQKASTVIPVRHYRGPLMDFWPAYPSLDLSAEDLASWRELIDENANWRVLRAQAEYWVDGRRSLADIARLLELETGQALGPAIERYFHILARAGLMTMQASP